MYYVYDLFVFRQILSTKASVWTLTKILVLSSVVDATDIGACKSIPTVGELLASLIVSFISKPYFGFRLQYLRNVPYVHKNEVCVTCNSKQPPGWHICIIQPLSISENTFLMQEQFTCNLESYMCSPCVRPPCEYRWIDRSTNSTVANKRKLSLKAYHGIPYAFRCTIVCPRGTSSSISYSIVDITCLGKNFLFVIL